MRRSRAAVLATLLLAGCTIQRWQPERAAPLDDHTMLMSAAEMRAPALAPLGALATAPGKAQGTPGLPPSNNSAAARLAASPRHAEWVKIAWQPGSRDSIMAWVVYPKSSRKAPVVVVVHEIFGLSTWVRGVADQVAAEGFIAIAPDFLSRIRGGPSTVELSGDSARKLIAGYPSADQALVIDAAASYAMTLPAAEKRYAVIGYCWGGSATFNHAINGGVMGFSGGVAFYGTPYATRGTAATATTPAVQSVVIADSVAKISKPLMLLSGSKDARITALMPQIDSLMKAMHKDYFQKNYEGAIHGFLRAQDDPASATRNEAEEAANLAATKDAWPRTVAFLKKSLGVR